MRARFDDHVAGGAIDAEVHLVEGRPVGDGLDHELVPAAGVVGDPQVDLGVAVAGHHHVHRVAHLAHLVDHLAARVRPVALLRGGARVGEHHDRLDAAPAQLGHLAVHRVRHVAEAEPAGVARQQVARRRRGCHADEADPHARALHDLVRGQQQLPVGVGHVGRRVREARAREARRGRVHEPARGVALEGARIGPLPAVEQAPELVHALVELVVAERGHVEADLVRHLDRGLVVEVGGRERGGAHEVPGVDLDRVPGDRGPLEVRREPRGAAEARSGRLDVPVQVVDAEQPQLHEPGGRRLGRRAVGAGVQAQ